MRALKIDENRRLHIAESPQQALPSDWVRVAVAYCAICGSDLHLREMPGVAGEGAVLGHEISGVIQEVGSAVEGEWKPGDRVVVWPKDGCGKCPTCKSGDNQMCQVEPWNETSMGLGTRPGAYAEEVLAPAHAVYAVPDALPLREACLTEPLSCCLHAIDRAGIGPDDTVVVVGGGVIGYLTAHALKSLGNSRHLVTEPVALRRERLRSTGITAVDVPQDPAELAAVLGSEPTVAIECVGSPTALAEAVRLVGPGGRVLAMGVSEHPLRLESVPLVTKEVTVIGSYAQNRSAFERALSLLAAGTIPVADIITTVVPLDDSVNTVMSQLTARQGSHQVVLINPQHPHTLP